MADARKSGDTACAACPGLEAGMDSFNDRTDHRPNTDARTMRRRPLKPYPPVGSPSRGGPLPIEARDGWELMLCGDLTEKQLELTERLVSLPPNSPGTIFFDSCGGSAYIGLAIATLIRLRGLDPLAVVAGECSSAAILPFAACRRRYVTAHSTLLFHPIRWQSEEDVRIEEAAEWARHFQKLEADLDQLVARFFGIDQQQLQTWTRPERFVSGAELVEAGLAQMVDLFAGDIWTQARKLRTLDETPSVGTEIGK